MLDYLVTSKVRRNLLKVLWADRLSGAVSELARLANVGFAGAYVELRHMEKAGLASSRREGNTVVYSARMDHPQARLLVGLFGGAPAVKNDLGDVPEKDVLLSLVSWGAPLGLGGSLAAPLSLESSLANALSLAHRNPTVARVLPVVLFRNRDQLDLNRLAFMADHLGEVRALGFFLDLTSVLSNDKRFHRFATTLRDRRVRRTSDFFVSEGGKYARKLAEANTPALAKRWYFRMNMGLDTFEALFRKFAR